jgi:hypothetical protein
MNTDPRRSATQARIERQSRTVSVKREAHKVLPNRMMCSLDSNTANIYTTTSNTTHPDPTLHVQTQAYTPIPKPNTQTKAKHTDQSEILRPNPNTTFRNQQQHPSLCTYVQYFFDCGHRGVGSYTSFCKNRGNKPDSYFGCKEEVKTTRSNGQEWCFMCHNNGHGGRRDAMTGGRH